jgi:exonuclease SbcC
MDSAEREKILTKLFPIELHKQLTARAVALAATATKQAETLTAQLKEARGGEQLDSDQAKAKKLELEGLAAEAKRLRDQALKERDQAASQLKTGQANIIKFTEHSKLTSEQQAFDAEPQKQQRQQRDAQLEGARKAALCDGTMQSHATRSRELAEATTALTNAQAELASATTALDKLAPEVAAIPAQQERIAELQREATQAEKRVEELGKLVSATDALKAAEEKVKVAARHVQQSQANLTTAQSKFSALDGIETERAGLQAQVAGLQQPRQKLDQVQGDAELLRGAPGRQAKQTKEEANARKSVTEANQALADEVKQVAELQAQREAHQAAALAAALHEGDPCPVCGSCQHPTLASAGGAVDPRAIGPTAPVVKDAFAKAVTTAEALLAKVLEGVRAEQEACKQALARLQANGWSDLPAYDAAEAAWKSQSATLQPQLDRAIATLAHRPELQAALQAAQTTLDTAKVRHGEAASLMATLHGQREALLDSLKSGSAADPAVASSATDPAAALAAEHLAQKARTTEQTQLSQLLTALQERLQAATTRKTQATTSVEERAHNLHNATAALQQALAALQQALTTHGFVDAQGQPDAALHTSSRRDPSWINKTDAARTAEHDAATRRAQRLQDLAAELQGETLPDLALLSTTAETRGHAFNIAELELRDRLAGSANFTARLERVQQLYDQLEQLNTGNAVAIELARELEGKSDSRIPFASWVLAGWLQQVLQKASGRLDTLSGGRYRFSYVEDVRDKRSKAGLEIDIYDSYSNGTRSVKSLSGGEKFLASLSLALGLAEVIQSNNGGIELDALFIDEGFGSLDNDTLEKAMQVLDELGQSRSGERRGRLVGLISHVESMKANIPCQVQVHRKAGGSTVTVVGATAA